MPNLRNYLVTFRIWNGWQYNDPKYFDTATEVIGARNKREAYEAAKAHASDSGYWQEDVTVRMKDVVPVKNPDPNLVAHSAEEIFDYMKSYMKS